MTDDRDSRRTTSAPPEGGAAGTGAGGIGDEARRRIGRNLRLLYGSVLDQPLPDRFTQLVDELTSDCSDREGSR